MSLPCERAVAIIRDRPIAASQADRVSIISGAISIEDVKLFGHMAMPIKIVSIMASKHSRADSRWVRWKARPMSAMKNVVIRINTIAE